MPLGHDPLTQYERLAEVQQPLRLGAGRHRGHPRRPGLSTDAPYRYDASAFRDVFEHRFTYLAGVQRNSHRFANRPALHDPATGRRWTYAELWADSGRLAAALQRNTASHAWRCHRLLALQRPGVRAAVAGRAAPGRDRRADQLPPLRRRDRPRARRQPPGGVRLRRGAGADRRRRDRRAPSTSHGSLVASGEEHRRRRTPFEELLVSAGRRGPASSAEAAPIYDETTRLYTSGTTGMPKGVSLSSLVDVLSAHDVIMHFPLSPRTARST